MKRRPVALLALAAAVGLLLSGCSNGGTVAVDPAENASDPGCASIVLNLPDAISEGEVQLDKRQTSAQATGAWGSPTAVIMRCGVAEPAPSSAACTTVDDVDWVNVAVEGSTYTFVSYGRTPAVEVTLDNTKASAVAALSAISPTMQRTEQYSQCT
ncbi:DUF3515 family protein [Agrococcus casei]|uniref:Conserved hypothetical lipoprotein n=1 Tax=Agrococcus casei LMG 22410 TaxID=1255656 RepID=A0A1R4G2J7_9MICO|nr:DUF3515 family protein [Agrococcus casei]SJM62388.1 conserved hypothetical lipoprotein [Agrococcus casei LMG 22410]